MTSKQTDCTMRLHLLITINLKILLTSERINLTLTVTDVPLQRYGNRPHTLLERPTDTTSR